MIPQEITEAYLRIAGGNGWNWKKWYQDYLANIFILPLIKYEVEEDAVSFIAIKLCSNNLHKLLFTDIPFAKAVWGEQEHKFVWRLTYYDDCEICGAIKDRHSGEATTQYCWQYKLQQLIIQLPEKWWDWLEENLPK